MDHSAASPTAIQNPQSPTPPVVSPPKKNLYLVVGLGILVLILIGTAAFIVLGRTTTQKAPQITTQPSLTPSPTVPLQTEYENPFDENSQYENPFGSEDEYQNPFEASS